MKTIRILFASSEVAPFVKVGGLADVIGTLPAELVKEGCDARVVLPLYKQIKRTYADRLTFCGWQMIKMGWRSLYAGLYMVKGDGIVFYFIDNEYYFNFDQVYVEYIFDIERYCFFQRAILAFMGDKMAFEPDVLHCNDWQTAMLPLLLDAHYRSQGLFLDVKTVLTIHNLKHQGVYGIEQIKDFLDLPDAFVSDELSVQYGAINFMKAGIVFSNSVTTVSPTYAYEIMTNYYGEGLDDVLTKYAYKISGILNGINYKEYNPTTDARIPMTYSFETYDEGKAAAKASLQRKMGLNVSPKTPLCTMVSRLVDQKGLDLLLFILDELLSEDIQLVVLGTGDPYYENALAQAAKRNPKKMAALICYDNQMAHTIYAAGDLYLMPSLFEPCGLSQLIAMKYGNIPIVRETGGLKDTVTPYNEFTGEGDGFSFANINAHELLFTTKYACDVYRNKKTAWQHLVKTAMQKDFLWHQSAKEYLGLYTLITDISLDEREKNR